MRTLFLAMLANYGCVAGAPNPDGGDWAPLSGQAGTGVSTSPEEAGAASGGATADPPSGSGGSGDASAAEAVAEVEETVAEVEETVTDLAEQVDALTERLSTAAAYTVTVESMGEVPIVLACDDETHLLIRWTVTSYGTGTWEYQGSEDSDRVSAELTFSWPLSATQTMEASQVELNGESYSDYYASLENFYYSSFTAHTPAIFEGLCLPLGE